MDKSSTVRKTMQKANISSDGECLRVHGHNTKNGNGGKAGILIHKAPHVGFVIGCIGPRLVGNRHSDKSWEKSSAEAMDFIFDAMGKFSKGKKAQLLVMDW